MSLKCVFCPEEARIVKHLFSGKMADPPVPLPCCIKHSAYTGFVHFPANSQLPTDDVQPVLQLVSAALMDRFVKWVEQNARQQSKPFVVIDGEAHYEVGRPPPAVVEYVTRAGSRQAVVRNVSGREIKAGEAVVVTSQGGMQHVDDHGQIRCWGEGCNVCVTPVADFLAYCSTCQFARCAKCGFAHGDHCLGVSPLFHPICPAPKLADRPERCSLHGCYRDAENGIEFCRTHATAVQMFPPPFHVEPKFAPGPECELPPKGYRCTRGKGHDGPCAAWPSPAPTHTGWQEFSGYGKPPGEPQPGTIHGTFTTSAAPPVSELVDALKARRDAYFDRLATRAASVITPEVGAALVADCEAVLGEAAVRRIEDSHGGQVDPDAPIIVNAVPPDGDHDATCMCTDCLPHPHPDELGVPGE